MDLFNLASDPAILALDWNSGLLGVVAGIMKMLAVLLVLGAAIKVVKDIQGGKVGAAVKVVFGTLVIVTFLWEPSLIERAIEAFSNVTTIGVNEVDNLTTPGK